MADATYTNPVQDQITAVDLVRTNIDWINQIARVHLRETWASGRVVERFDDVKASDFVSFLTAWNQATPKKKQLNWLATTPGYEPNITVNATLNG